MSNQNFYGPVYGPVAGGHVYVHGHVSPWAGVDAETLNREREVALELARHAGRDGWFNVANAALLLQVAAAMIVGLLAVEALLLLPQVGMQAFNESVSSAAMVVCAAGLAVSMNLTKTWALRIKRRARAVRTAALQEVQAIDVELRRLRLLARGYRD